MLRYKIPRILFDSSKDSLVKKIGLGEQVSLPASFSMKLQIVLARSAVIRLLRPKVRTKSFRDDGP